MKRVWLTMALTVGVVGCGGGSGGSGGSSEAGKPLYPIEAAAKKPGGDMPDYMTKQPPNAGRKQGAAS